MADDGVRLWVTSMASGDKDRAPMERTERGDLYIKLSELSVLPSLVKDPGDRNLTMKYIEDRFLWLEKITTTTADGLERRLEGMNEFRDTLRDQASRFCTRDEMNTLHKLVEADLRTLRESAAELKGKASQNGLNVALLISVVGAVSGVISTILVMIRR